MAFLETVIRTAILFLFSILVSPLILVGFLIRGRKLFQWGKNHPLPPALINDYTHKFAELSEVTLHYVEKGPKDGPLVLFVHGFPEFWYSWRHQINHFAALGYRCIAVDQRGYGESSRPEGRKHYQMTKLTGDLKELVQSLGYAKATVVAHDWGGAICWALAHLHPEVVKHLIIMNCTHPVAFEEVVKAKPMQILRSWYILFFQAPFLPELMIAMNDFFALRMAFRMPLSGFVHQKNHTDVDEAAWLATFTSMNDMTGPINYYRSIMDNKWLKATKNKIKAPVLVIWGEQDHFLVKEGACQSQEMCEDSQVHLIPDASHWVQQDTPKEIMEKWLADR